MAQRGLESVRWCIDVLPRRQPSLLRLRPAVAHRRVPGLPAVLDPGPEQDLRCAQPSGTVPAVRRVLHRSCELRVPCPAEVVQPPWPQQHCCRPTQRFPERMHRPTQCALSGTTQALLEQSGATACLPTAPAPPAPLLPSPPPPPPSPPTPPPPVCSASLLYAPCGHGSCLHCAGPVFLGAWQQSAAEPRFQTTSCMCRCGQASSTFRVPRRLLCLASHGGKGSCVSPVLLPWPSCSCVGGLPV